MPDAPDPIEPPYTPTTPSAPQAVVGGYSPAAPAAPGQIVAPPSGSAPGAPGDIVPVAGGDEGLIVSGTLSPDVTGLLQLHSASGGLEGTSVWTSDGVDPAIGPFPKTALQVFGIGETRFYSLRRYTAAGIYAASWNSSAWAAGDPPPSFGPGLTLTPAGTATGTAVINPAGPAAPGAIVPAYPVP